jgi:PKD repeat protein
MSIATVTITVNEDLIPMAGFTTNATIILVGDWIEFTDATTGGNLPLSCQWNFGDGSAISTLINPVHQYLANGTYTVTLIVTDGDGDSDSYTMEIVVNSSSSLGESSHGIPRYTSGLLLLSAGLMIFILLKRKRNRNL